jgi:hypothetical protein
MMQGHQVTIQPRQMQIVSTREWIRSRKRDCCRFEHTQSSPERVGSKGGRAFTEIHRLATVPKARVPRLQFRNHLLRAISVPASVTLRAFESWLAVLDDILVVSSVGEQSRVLGFPALYRHHFWSIGHGLQVLRDGPSIVVVVVMVLCCSVA